MCNEQKPNPIIGTIIEEFLKTNGFDGLFNPLCECGCEIDDLMPCAEPHYSCEAGYKVPCDCSENHPWHMARAKPTDKEKTT